MDSMQPPGLTAATLDAMQGMCTGSVLKSLPHLCTTEAPSVHSAGGGGGYGGGGGGGGFSARIAPDREAAQGTVARPGRATRLPTADETERQLDEVMATVPDELKARAAVACWHRAQGVGLLLMTMAWTPCVRSSWCVLPKSLLAQVPAHRNTLKHIHSASHGSYGSCPQYPTWLQASYHETLTMQYS